jgi:DNA-binding response OmpR family regulator
MKKLLNILLVEDNPGDVALLRGVLLKPPPVGQFLLAQEGTVQQAVDRLLRETPDVILLDLNLPDSRGTDTVRRMREAAKDCPIIVLTSMDDEATGVAAIHLGVQDYLVKGTIDARTLGRTVRYAMERFRLEKELARANSQLEVLLQQRTEELEKSITLLGQEITEHENSQAAFEELQEVLAAMLNAMPVVLFVTTPDMNRMLYCSKAYERIWGRPRKEVFENPRSWIDAVHPEDRPGLEAEIAQRTGQLPEGPAESLTSGFRIVRPDGVTTNIRCRVFEIPVEKLQMRLVCGIAEEVPATGGEPPESGDAVLVLGPDGTIKSLNDAAARLLGCIPAEALGKHICDLAPPAGTKHARSLSESLRHLIGRR